MRVKNSPCLTSILAKGVPFNALRHDLRSIIPDFCVAFCSPEKWHSFTAFDKKHVMQEPEKNDPANLHPDLKHDTMEYNAASEGDDPIDTNKEFLIEAVDEDVTAEELNSLEDDSEQHQADALLSAENDSRNDEDNFINEPDSKVEDPIISDVQEPIDETEDERTSH
jgi:hypothetical protein